MTNSKSLFQGFIQRITIPEDTSEIESIALIALHEIFNLNRSDVLLNKSIDVTIEQTARMEEFLRRINSNEPIQHITGHAHFMGREFIVNRGVLIPRPETEELVMLALKHLQNIKSPRVLDIATGSGCIPISLSLEIKGSEIYGTDISDEALAIATKNKEHLQANVNFFKHDILLEEIRLADLDLITSNPPYIALSEKSAMQKQVVDFEPHLALFVPNDDPLIFYRVIAKKAFPILNSGGMLVVEINQRFGREVSEVLQRGGFQQVSIVKDISGNDRIVNGIKL